MSFDLPPAPRGDEAMRRLIVLVGLLAASILMVPAPAGATATDRGLALEVVSSPRATFVTGGSALVRLSWRDPLRTDQVSVFAGGRDVTGAFVAQARRDTARPGDRPARRREPAGRVGSGAPGTGRRCAGRCCAW
jgi:hypothetical protein